MLLLVILLWLIKLFLPFKKKKKKSREPDSNVAFIRKTIWCGFLPNKSFKQGKMTILSSNSNYKGAPMKGNFIFSPYGLYKAALTLFIQVYWCTTHSLFYPHISIFVPRYNIMTSHWTDISDRTFCDSLRFKFIRFFSTLLIILFLIKTFFFNVLQCFMFSFKTGFTVFSQAKLSFHCTCI